MRWPNVSPRLVFDVLDDPSTGDLGHLEPPGVDVLALALGLSVHKPNPTIPQDGNLIPLRTTTSKAGSNRSRQDVLVLGQSRWRGPTPYSEKV